MQGEKISSDIPRTSKRFTEYKFSSEMLCLCPGNFLRVVLRAYQPCKEVVRNFLSPISICNLNLSRFAKWIFSALGPKEAFTLKVQNVQYMSFMLLIGKQKNSISVCKLKRGKEFFLVLFVLYHSVSICETSMHNCEGKHQ